MDERAQRFLDLSALLTGYGRVQLLGTGMFDDYLRTVDEGLPAGVLDELLAAYDRLPEDGREAAASEVLADPQLGPVARELIVLWYCGTWAGRVVSPAAYLGGLQWVAAGAHPIGARQQGYGAWAVAPEEVEG